MELVVLIAGLIFPTISWLTFIACTLQATFAGKSSSGVYIPIIGPILLDIWILLINAPGWTLAIPWIADIGTIIFALAIPRLFAEFWQTSIFTRTFTLEGAHTNQRAIISFHKGGHYLLTKNWTRRPGEAGVSSVGEPGTYYQHATTIELKSHAGFVRQIKENDGIYAVVDSTSPEDYQLDGWTFRATSTK